MYLGFRDIPPFDDKIKPYYQIDSDGIVINKITGATIIPHKNENGYWQVSLMTETGRVFRKVHRLVLLVFDYNPNHKFLQGNHKNGNKDINSLYNLEWATPKENKAHAINNNLSNGMIGSYNPKAVLSEYEVMTISEMILSGYPIEMIMKSFPYLSHYMILNIVSGKTWSHLFDQKILELLYSEFHDTISITERHMICEYFQLHSMDDVKHGSVMQKIKNALLSIGLELSSKNIRIAKRLYYKYDSPEITSLYKY